MRISDWSSDVCSSDLTTYLRVGRSNRAGRANVNPGRSMTCRGLCFLGANALFRAPSRRAHHDPADRPMHRRRPESHAIHTYFRLGKALLTESWHRAGIVLRMRGYRIVAIRLICVLVRSEEHTSELQSLMRISYAVFCLKKNKNTTQHTQESNSN